MVMIYLQIKKGMEILVSKPFLKHVMLSRAFSLECSKDFLFPPNGRGAVGNVRKCREGFLKATRNTAIITNQTPSSSFPKEGIAHPLLF
jgi:hypothetical protein